MCVFVEAKKRTRTTTERPFTSVMELQARKRHASLFSVDADKALRSQSNLASAISREAVNELNRPMSRMDIFYTGSITNVMAAGEQPQLLGSAAGQTRIKGGQSVLSLVSPQAPTTATTWQENILAVLKGMLDVSLLTSPSFICKFYYELFLTQMIIGATSCLFFDSVIALGGFLTLCGFFVPFIYLPRVAMSQPIGATKQQANALISILGLTNIFARIFCGCFSTFYHYRPAAVPSSNPVCLGGCRINQISTPSQFTMLH